MKQIITCLRELSSKEKPNPILSYWGLKVLVKYDDISGYIMVEVYKDSKLSSQVLIKIRNRDEKESIFQQSEKLEDSFSDDF